MVASPRLSLSHLHFFFVWDCTIHRSVGRNEECRIERRLKVARGLGRKEVGPENVKLKQKQHQYNLVGQGNTA